MRRTEHGQVEIQKNEDPNSGGVSEDKEFLRTEPLGKLLLKLALPLQPSFRRRSPASGWSASCVERGPS